MIHAMEKVLVNTIKEAYRDPDIYEQTEKALADTYENKVTPERMGAFFGCDPGEFSSEELALFRAYARYAGKRLIIGVLKGAQKDAPPTTKERILKKLKKHEEQWGSLALHDVAHTFVSYGRDPAEGKVIPAFLRTDDWVNNPELIRDELIAILWNDFFLGRPVIISMLRKETREELLQNLLKRYKEQSPEWTNGLRSLFSSVDERDPSSVVSGYCQLVLLILGPVNLGSAENTGMDPEKVNEEFTRLAEDIYQTPEPLLTRLVERVIREYPSNPRVLYDIFSELCAPILRRL